MIKNPIVPKSKSDPVGANRILSKAFADIKARYKGATKAVLAAFDAIPTYAINAEFDAVAYGLSAADRTALSERIQAILDQWLVDGRTYSNFFYADYSSAAVAQGTAVSYANLSALSAVYASSETLSTIIHSEAYSSAIATAQFKSYEHWTNISTSAKADLMELITSAVASGKSPKSVVGDISRRMEVSRSKALQYAQTDITDTLRQTTLANDNRVQKQYGLKTGLLWTSAFLATTRPNHAARSGRVYTAEEVQAFYATGGNRYSCHCSITTVLLDDDGKPMLTDKLKEAMSKERETWEKAQEG